MAIRPNVCRSPRLRGKPRLRLAADCAAGLAFLHAQTPPIVHNDLKSFNILVTKGGDFGFVAKLADLECVPGPCRSAAPHPALARRSSAVGHADARSPPGPGRAWLTRVA